MRLSIPSTRRGRPKAACRAPNVGELVKCLFPRKGGRHLKAIHAKLLLAEVLQRGGRTLSALAGPSGQPGSPPRAPQADVDRENEQGSESGLLQAESSLQSLSSCLALSLASTIADEADERRRAIGNSSRQFGSTKQGFSELEEHPGQVTKLEPHLERGGPRRRWRVRLTRLEEARQRLGCRGREFLESIQAE